jgi:uncharacterized protein
MLSSSEVLATILERPTELSHVRSLVTEDLTYVSLNFENPDLHTIMPWCGTHDHAGPESIVQIFVDAARSGRSYPSRWRRCSARASTQPAAMFGRFPTARTSCPKWLTPPSLFLRKSGTAAAITSSYSCMLKFNPSRMMWS